MTAAKEREVVTTAIRVKRAAEQLGNALEELWRAGSIYSGSLMGVPEIETARTLTRLALRELEGLANRHRTREPLQKPKRGRRAAVATQ